MQLVYDKIIELKNNTTISKHDQLVNGIIQSVDAKILKKGDRLPSINVMVQDIGYARKTIVKAYEELKNRGIVESQNFKGYYIANVNTKTKLRVALVLYSFHSFQEDFYNTFRESLGKKYIINVFFHHNNMDSFKDIFNRISGRYGMYVIAPIQTTESSLLLQKIPSDKLLIIDRQINLPADYSYVTQEFEESTFQQLTKLLPEISRFNKFVLFYRDDSDYPEGILNAFNKFIKHNNINGKIMKKYKKDSVEKNCLYFFISDYHLWDVLRECKNKDYEIGADVGILAHNDNAIKEIAFGGITTISTDFKQMAIEAATVIKDGINTHKIIPSELIKRNSI